jgi:lysophospholipase L1-like esterase
MNGKMTKAKIALLAVGLVILTVSSGLIVLFFENRGNTTKPANMIRVACIGDSITEGSDYPANLQIMLGTDYDVRNFGVSGSTVLQNTDMPYLDQNAYQKSKTFQPSIVIIMLGTNDARVNTFSSIDNFSNDYRTLISGYQRLLSNPRILLVTPPPIFENELDLTETNLCQGVIPQIEQVANELNLPTIDINTVLIDYPDYFGDGVHPSSEGAMLIASEINQAIIFNGFADSAP